MPRIGPVDLGSQCQSCGKVVESHYRLNVVVHGKRGRRSLQHWCVECVAKASPGSASVAVSHELGRDGKLIQLRR